MIFKFINCSIHVYIHVHCITISLARYCNFYTAWKKGELIIIITILKLYSWGGHYVKSNLGLFSANSMHQCILKVHQSIQKCYSTHKS